MKIVFGGKMIKHVVIWKLKKENCLENAKKIKKDLEALKEKIKIIKEIKVNITEKFLDDENSYDVILISFFENISDLKSYQNDSEHVKVADFIKSCSIKRAFIDFEDEIL